MQHPLRKTRRRIAYWIMGLLSMVIIWMMLPGDIGPSEQALASAVIPSLVLGIVAFITGETYSDHSERKFDNNEGHNYERSRSSNRGQGPQ